MSRRLLTGNGAAAWGARLARADYVRILKASLDRRRNMSDQNHHPDPDSSST